MKRQLFEGTYPEPSKLKPIRNGDRMKPEGGLWTSTFIRRPYWSEWVQWCVSTNFRGPEFNLYALYPKWEAKVLTIADIDAFNALPEYSPYPGMKYIDYEKIARSYDGLRLTQEFINAYRFDYRNEYHLTLYSWDVESTLWFNWAFMRVKTIGKVVVKRP